LPIPFYRISFVFLMLLDISSHWLQMYSSLACMGGSHHKSEDGNRDKNFLVRCYYWFFGYLCVGAKFTYVLLYVRIRLATEQQQQSETNTDEETTTIIKFVTALLAVCLPGMLAKQAVNVAQLCSSCYTIAKYDAEIASETKSK
jgi:CDP-diacylglycerol--inositol 3-phosphatidyltransferase